MNKTEHLLICLMEECAEIQQAAAKALRFGITNGHPDSKTTNAEDIVKEYADLKGVIHMLSDLEDTIFLEAVDLMANEKKERVEKYMKYAESKKLLE